MSNGGGSGNQARAPAAQLDEPRRAAYAHARAYDYAWLYAHLLAYVALAVKGSGLLALLLSTVILLGGYVQSLVKEDFFCIMAITVIQAAGIFQDWEVNAKDAVDLAVFLGRFFTFLAQISGVLILVVCPLLVLICFTAVFYMFGPLICAAISSWRIAKLNHGNNMDGTDSTADMMATLNIFYSLIIFQGTMSLVFLFLVTKGKSATANRLLALEQLPEKWGLLAIGGYIYDISVKCRKHPPSIKGRDLIKYAAELLDSESHQDYLYGARLLSAFIKKGEDVSWVLLPSRHRIQRLIDSLGISSSSHQDDACVELKSEFSRGKFYAVIGDLDDKKEMRELAATIVADVAAHIEDLSNYPGAMRCISSLLQHQEKTEQTYRNRNSKQVPDDLPLHQTQIGPLTKWEQELQDSQERRMQWAMRLDKERRIGMMTDQRKVLRRPKEHRHRNKREGGSTSNKLVQQGLTILERLASNNDDNRSIICSTPGLLPKITAPVYSATLIQDVKTKAWADIVTRCLKVLYQLIRAPEGRHEIFSNNVQAVSNLKIILELGNNEAYHQELQLVAMKILTELALDPSINLTEETKKVLVTKQLHHFLLANGDDEEESAAIAGRAMVSLSTGSESNSALIMTTENDIIGRLTEILDDSLNTRRTIAAEIMANLCAHCNVDNMKEILPKVLREILSIKRKSQETEESGGQSNPASGDEENQGNSVCTNTEERHNISTQGDDTEVEEISDQEREKQEAFLCLAQVICDKLNSAELDGAIQKAVDENNAIEEEKRREVFVVRLKTIIDDYCHPTADCLRIVKLCGRIAKSVIRCEQYVEIFRNRDFKSSLSKASETMCELESCMLFVGTDFGLRKTVRPLFSEIEKTWSEM